MEHCDLVRPAPEPAEFVETAQHAVRTLTAEASDAHPPRPRGGGREVEDGHARTRWRDRYQVAHNELEFTAEDDLPGLFAVRQVNVRKPDRIRSRMVGDSGYLPDYRTDNADDHAAAP